MSIAINRVTKALKYYQFNDWRRIIPTKHSATPTDTGPGNTRFVSLADPYRVLYAAIDFKTAFAEAIVRDEYEGIEDRELPRKFIDDASLAILSGPPEGLLVLNISGDGAYMAGINTDAKGSREHTAGQALARELHAIPEIDGIVFSSRLGATDCIAIFDRSFDKLRCTDVYPLRLSAELAPELRRMEIKVV